MSDPNDLRITAIFLTEDILNNKIAKGDTTSVVDHVIIFVKNNHRFVHVLFFKITSSVCGRTSNSPQIWVIIAFGKKRSR